MTSGYQCDQCKAWYHPPRITLVLGRYEEKKDFCSWYCAGSYSMGKTKQPPRGFESLPLDDPNTDNARLRGVWEWDDDIDPSPLDQVELSEHARRKDLHHLHGDGFTTSRGRRATYHA